MPQSASPPQCGLPQSASPPQGGLPQTNTNLINQTVVNNDGCNFGTASTSNHNETQIAVENVVRLAEAHHHNKVVNMAETASQEHHQLMANLKANLTQEAQLALHRQAEDHSREREKLQRYSAIHAENVAGRYSAMSAENENALSDRVRQLEMAHATARTSECTNPSPKGAGTSHYDGSSFLRKPKSSAEPPR